MSDPQRTHAPSAKRIKEFRKRGELAMSREVTSAAALAGAVIGLVATASRSTTAILDFTRKAALATDGRGVAAVGGELVHTFVTVVGPPLIVSAILAALAIVGQIGIPPALKMPGFDLTKLNPISNLMNTYAIGAVMKRTFGALAKMIVVGAIVTVALRTGIATHAINPGDLAATAWHLATRSLWLVVLALAAVATVDYLLARRKIQTQMKMTADEVKREHRESEGDPQVKGKRRQRMRELAKRRLAQAVPTATVVIVNPTHYAVALRYDESKDRAPIVVAKGTDEVAERIRELARKSGIPILPRPPLARALHKHCKEGQTVPTNLYKAVAEVLAFVYRIKAGN